MIASPSQSFVASATEDLSSSRGEAAHEAMREQPRHHGRQSGGTTGDPPLHSRRRMNRESWKSSGTTILLTLVAAAAALVDGSLLELQRGGSAWRIVTCHFTHFSYEQLAWDALTFFTLGWACERRNRSSFHATLLASVVIIPLAVLLFDPRIATYRGLSGIDSALFALLVISAARTSRIGVALAIAFACKVVFELTTGATVFVTNMGEGVEPVPIAHVAGALIGVAVSAIPPAAGRLRAAQMNGTAEAAAR
jgi:rhomboid family GlyGly-CTERM serine protease